MATRDKIQTSHFAHDLDVAFCQILHANVIKLIAAWQLRTEQTQNSQGVEAGEEWWAALPGGSRGQPQIVAVFGVAKK